MVMTADAEIVELSPAEPRRLSPAEAAVLVAVGIDLDVIQDELDSPVAKGWWKDGGCEGMDPDLFFPERGASTKEAKAACGRCSVQHACLIESLQMGDKHGIWGGMSERERRRVRRLLVKAGIVMPLRPPVDVGAGPTQFTPAPVVSPLRKAS
jgi:WhiB family transcriptional regulator, redox-sensing transcriptional regulator